MVQQPAPAGLRVANRQSLSVAGQGLRFLTRLPGSPTIPAVIAGAGLGALGALRLLHRSGVPSYCLSIGTGPGLESSSRWYRAFDVAARQPTPQSSLQTSLEIGRIERGVLLPCSDALVREVSSLPPALASRFPSSTPSVDAIRALTNKAEFAHLLERLDIPRPRTIVVDNGGSLEPFPAAQLFLKPVDSASFMRRYGVKACRVRDVAEARELWMRLHAEGQQVVLQEYVPGAASDHFLIDGFASTGGEVRALLARRRLRMHPADFGDSTCIVSVPLSEVAPAVQALKSILAAVRYRGIFSAEFKRDARDGIFKILEINARIWIYVEFAGRCGVDVCTMAYQDALGLPLSLPRSYRAGARLIAPYHDLAGAHQAWLEGSWRFIPWARSWFGAQQPHFKWNDPGPALRTWRQIASRLVRRLWRSVRSV